MKGSGQIHKSNATKDGGKYKRWFIGSFIPSGSITHSQRVEIKFDKVSAGDKRPKSEATASPNRKSLAFLISGEITYLFPGRRVRLQKAGDYVIWDPGVLHWWKVKKDSVVMTLRWIE